NPAPPWCTPACRPSGRNRGPAACPRNPPAARARRPWPAGRNRARVVPPPTSYGPPRGSRFGSAAARRPRSPPFGPVVLGQGAQRLEDAADPRLGLEQRLFKLGEVLRLRGRRAGIVVSGAHQRLAHALRGARRVEALLDRKAQDRL